MSQDEKIEFANAEPESEEIAAALPVRRSKRRNCMMIPGTSDPMVAKLFAETLMKEVFGKVEADPYNPEN
jgi:hypothetical protein